MDGICAQALRVSTEKLLHAATKNIRKAQKSLARAFYLCQCRPMEHLNTYLEQNGLKAKWFAERVGIKPGRISRIRTGKAKPDLSEALRIAEFTKSAVPVEAWQ